jgi:hypothetical protein
MMVLRAKVTTYQQCHRCRRTDHLIIDDGPTVCFECVALLTDAAADPIVITSRLRDTLADLHADVVQLVDDAGTLSWAWVGWK